MKTPTEATIPMSRIIGHGIGPSSYISVEDYKYALECGLAQQRAILSLIDVFQKRVEGWAKQAEDSPRTDKLRDDLIMQFLAGKEMNQAQISNAVFDFARKLEKEKGIALSNEYLKVISDIQHSIALNL